MIRNPIPPLADRGGVSRSDHGGVSRLDRGALADQIVGDKGLKPLVFISRWGKLRINFGFSDIFLESQFNLSTVEFT